MYLFFDTETTGVIDYKQQFNVNAQPHIVQLGAILMTPQARVMGQIDLLIKPNGWTIPPEAQAVHGISTEDCEQYGVPILSGIAALNLFIRNHPEVTVVAHNDDFDQSMVKFECKRLDKPFILEGRKRFCTMKATTNLCKIPGPRGFKWPKLAELHRFLFKEDFDNAHSAIADVQACARCFFELKKAEAWAVNV